MEILAFRHGIALDRREADALGIADSERPLTDAGRSRTRTAVRGLHAVLEDRRVDAIITSPYLRAVQTGRVLAEVFVDALIVESAELRPGVGPEAINAWLREQPLYRRALLVGHEPDLSEWASWCLGRRNARILSLKKSGCCLLDFPGSPETGAGTLRWLLTAGQLRGLGACFPG